MLMNYHIGRLVLSSLCVGVFVAAGIWWCSFYRLKHNIRFAKFVNDKFVTVHNDCSKIPPSTSTHFATRVRRSRVVRLS